MCRSFTSSSITRSTTVIPISSFRRLRCSRSDPVKQYVQSRLHGRPMFRAIIGNRPASTGWYGCDRYELSSGESDSANAHRPVALLEMKLTSGRSVLIENTGVDPESWLMYLPFYCSRAAELSIGIIGGTFRTTRYLRTSTEGGTTCNTSSSYIFLPHRR